MLIAAVILLKSCKEHDKLVIDDPNPVNPIDTSSESKLDCFIGKHEKPDIYFIKYDTSRGVAVGYKNCYIFKANAFLHYDSLSNSFNFGLNTYWNERKKVSYIRESYDFINIPFVIGCDSFKFQNIPFYKVDDDLIWAEYLLDSTKNNYLKLTYIDRNNRIVKGQLFAQYYFNQIYNPNDFRSEPDTVRLQEVNFWAKY